MDNKNLKGHKFIVASIIMIFLYLGNALAGPPINQLLNHVVRHEVDEAEAIIKMNPQILLQKGQVIDYSNRVFDDITPFQYALWAYDFTMWNMILTYLPKNEAKVQYNNFPSTRAAAQYGLHFNFNELLNAAQDFVDNCYDLWGVCIDKITKVALAERKVPAHFAKNFTDGDWFPLSPYIGLGYDWVRVISGNYVCDVDYEYYRRQWCPTSHAMHGEINDDIKVVTNYKKICFDNLDELEKKLKMANSSAHFW